jgi:hypothetical protein
LGDCRRIATVGIGATGFEPRHRANVMQDDCRVATIGRAACVGEASRREFVGRDD